MKTVQEVEKAHKEYIKKHGHKPDCLILTKEDAEALGDEIIFNIQTYNIAVSVKVDEKEKVSSFGLVEGTTVKR